MLNEKCLSATELLRKCFIAKENKQVRLSRATLEFQDLQVPTGLKVFNSQVIYLIYLTLSQRSLLSKTFRFQKKFNKKLRVTYFGSKNILVPKNFRLDNLT